MRTEWIALLLSASAYAASTTAPATLTPPAAHHTVALCAPDEELIEAHLGANATARSLRQRLVRLGAPAAKLDATRAVLARDLAAAMRAMASITHGSKLDNVTALRVGLELKGEPFAEADSAAALLERLEQRLEKECFVVNPRRPLSMSLALEDLQSAAAERMLTSSGNRLELLDRLYHFQIACDRMVRAACRSTHTRTTPGRRAPLSPAGGADSLSLSLRTAPKIKSPSSSPALPLPLPISL